MSKDWKNHKTGIITEWLPNMEFRVECNGQSYRCYVSGKMKQNRIKIAIGDKVRFIYPPGSSVGRIEYRYRLDEEE